MLVAHVEQVGVWIVEGGMSRLANTLANLARAKGVTFRYGERVTSVVTKAGRARGVELAHGERIAADAVVMNGDVSALAAGLLGQDAVGSAPPTPRANRSLSAITWAIAAKTDGFALTHHNVFFSKDYPAEFRDIFARSRLPRAPTVYVCAQDRDGSADQRAGALGAERLLCLVNAPATGDLEPFDDKELQSCEVATFALLARCGLKIMGTPEATVRTTPTDFERLFPATGGALYGRASHGWMASFARSGARTRLPGLYLAGGSVHPGPGAPMAALSGRQAASSVMADLASTNRLVPAATPGGISTR
jgi:1-hydroxycarotenoid 3,4-desaturase